MRKLLALALLACVSTATFAADASCEAKATEKKLAGAAKNSFVKKCEKDSKAAGAQAMLVGESLMRQADVTAATRALLA